MFINNITTYTYINTFVFMINLLNHIHNNHTPMIYERTLSLFLPPIF